MFASAMTISELQQQRVSLLQDRFHQLYGNGPVSILRAPARINVLGEHVDYVSYLPTASLVFGSGEHDMLMLFRATETTQVRGVSTNQAFAPFVFTLDERPELKHPGSADDGWTEWLYKQAAPAPHWSNYVKGPVFFARFKHGERIGRGFDFLIDSTIPPKGGASSSSALTVLAGAAIRQVNQVDYEAHTLARESSQAEWYVGTRGGAMDHKAICLSKPQHAVHLSYAEDTAELVPLLNDRYRWITFFSHEADKGREVMLAYNERAAVARLLIPAIIAESAKPLMIEDEIIISTTGEEGRHGESRHKSKSARERLARLPAASPCPPLPPWLSFAGKFSQSSILNDIQTRLDELPASITLHEIARLSPQTFAECQRAFPALVQARQEVPIKLRDRARHHLGEMQRVDAAVKLLSEGNETEEIARRLGELLNASHTSLRDLYEVCTPPVNQLIEIITIDSDVYGARLMGGGFGGNVLALTTAENVPKLIERVQHAFYAPQQRDGLREGAVMISTPGEGLSKPDL